MSSHPQRVTVLFAAMAVSLSSCTLFSPTVVDPRLDLFFRLEQTLVENRRIVVASWIAAGPVTLEDRFVRVSGSLLRPEGSSRPRQVLAMVEIVSVETGKVLDRLRLKLDIRRENTFRRTKKFARRIRAGSLVTVSVKPKGADLPAGSDLRLCVDLSTTRAELATEPSCAAGDGPATLSAIQERVFTPSCARGGCHDAASAQASLVLADGAAFDNLVGVGSTQVFRFLRVRPRDPEASYLIKKLRGSADIMGVRMPSGGPVLTDEQIAGIYDWVETGAPNN